MGILSRLVTRRYLDGPSSEVDAPLRAEEVLARGGTYSGLLFDNPSIGLTPSLTSFDFDCNEVERADDRSPVGVTVEWLPMQASSWASLAPHRASGRAFGKAAEASVYFYEHHRFDAFELVLQEQRGSTALATPTLRGDLDGLGLDPVRVSALLRFTGFTVYLSDVNSSAEALERLATFTLVDGLALRERRSSGAYQFEPDQE